jgi:hypothetical protein
MQEVLAERTSNLTKERLDNYSQMNFEKLNLDLIYPEKIGV